MWFGSFHTIKTCDMWHSLFISGFVWQLETVGILLINTIVSSYTASVTAPAAYKRQKIQMLYSLSDEKKNKTKENK